MGQCMAATQPDPEALTSKQVDDLLAEFHWRRLNKGPNVLLIRIPSEQHFLGPQQLLRQIADEAQPIGGSAAFEAEEIIFDSINTFLERTHSSSSPPSSSKQTRKNVGNRKLPPLDTLRQIHDAFQSSPDFCCMYDKASSTSHHRDRSFMKTSSNGTGFVMPRAQLLPLFDLCPDLSAQRHCLIARSTTSSNTQHIMEPKELKSEALPSQPPAKQTAASLFSADCCGQPTTPDERDMSTENFLIHTQLLPLPPPLVQIVCEFAASDNLGLTEYMVTLPKKEDSFFDRLLLVDSSSWFPLRLFPWLALSRGYVSPLSNTEQRRLRKCGCISVPAYVTDTNPMPLWINPLRHPVFHMVTLAISLPSYSDSLANRIAGLVVLNHDHFYMHVSDDMCTHIRFWLVLLTDVDQCLPSDYPSNGFAGPIGMQQETCKPGHGQLYSDSSPAMPSSAPAPGSSSSSSTRIQSCLLADILPEFAASCEGRNPTPESIERHIQESLHKKVREQNPVIDPRYSVHVYAHSTAHPFIAAPRRNGKQQTSQDRGEAKEAIKKESSKRGDEKKESDVSGRNEECCEAKKHEDGCGWSRQRENREIDTFREAVYDVFHHTVFAHRYRAEVMTGVHHT